MSTTEVQGLFVDGGEVSSFSIEDGNYHVKVEDAGNGQSDNTQRGHTWAQLVVHNDPNHAAREGKKLMKMFVNFPMPDDPEDKAKIMRGFRKRLIYDGFGFDWPKKTETKPFDPRKLIGREAWVQIRTDKDGKSNVYAVAQDIENLPKLKKAAIDPATAAASNKKNGATSERRR